MGINPVSGGRPPRESRAKAVVDARIGAFDHIIVMVLIFVADAIFRDKNAVDVMKMYVPSASKVS